jgi:hypothetical protein
VIKEHFGQAGSRALSWQRGCDLQSVCLRERDAPCPGNLGELSDASDVVTELFRTDGHSSRCVGAAAHSGDEYNGNIWLPGTEPK